MFQCHSSPEYSFGDPLGRYNSLITMGALQIQDRSPQSRIGDRSRRATASSHENVGHSETGFLGRSSDLDRSSGNGLRVYETGLVFATLPMFAVMSNFVQVILNIPMFMNALSAIKKEYHK